MVGDGDGDGMVVGVGVVGVVGGGAVDPLGWDGGMGGRGGTGGWDSIQSASTLLPLLSSRRKRKPSGSMSQSTSVRSETVHVGFVALTAGA